MNYLEVLSSGVLGCVIVNAFIDKVEGDLRFLKALKRYCDLNEDLLDKIGKDHSTDMVNLTKEIYNVFTKEIKLQKHSDVRSINSQLKMNGIDDSLQLILGYTTINYINVSNDNNDAKFLKKFIDGGFLTVNFVRTKTYQYEEIMKAESILNKNEFNVNTQGMMGSSIDESIGICKKEDLKNAYATVIVVNSDLSEVEHIEYLNLKKVYIRFVDRGTCKTNFKI